jgi:hypothetical protein
LQPAIHIVAASSATVSMIKKRFFIFDHVIQEETAK